MIDYEQDLRFDGNTFDACRMDTDIVLQKLLKTMMEKGSSEGTLSIKIDVKMERQTIPNTNPNKGEESRIIVTPTFVHKISSCTQIKSSADGRTNFDGQEMVWDEDSGQYVVKMVTDTWERSIFDADFKEVDEEPEPTNPLAIETTKEDDFGMNPPEDEFVEPIELPFGDDIEDIDDGEIDIPDNLDDDF